MSVVYFSTKSKKTRKQKEKQKDAWKEYQAKYGLTENKQRTGQIVKPWIELRSVPLRPGAMDFLKHNSVDSGAAVATKPAQTLYTGDKVIGIGCMHKSNLVPIFSADAAVDLSKMRRG